MIKSMSVYLLINWNSSSVFCYDILVKIRHIEKRWTHFTNAINYPATIFILYSGLKIAWKLCIWIGHYGDPNCSIAALKNNTYDNNSIFLSPPNGSAWYRTEKYCSVQYIEEILKCTFIKKYGSAPKGFTAALLISGKLSAMLDCTIQLLSIALQKQQKPPYWWFRARLWYLQCRGF